MVEGLWRRVRRTIGGGAVKPGGGNADVDGASKGVAVANELSMRSKAEEEKRIEEGDLEPLFAKLEIGSVVKLKGGIGEYRDVKQVDVKRMCKCVSPFPAPHPFHSWTYSHLQ